MRHTVRSERSDAAGQAGENQHGQNYPLAGRRKEVHDLWASDDDDDDDDEYDIDVMEDDDDDDFIPTM